MQILPSVHACTQERMDSCFHPCKALRHTIRAQHTRQTWLSGNDKQTMASRPRQFPCRYFRPSMRAPMQYLKRPPHGQKCAEPRNRKIVLTTHDLMFARILKYLNACAVHACTALRHAERAQPHGTSGSAGITNKRIHARQANSTSPPQSSIAHVHTSCPAHPAGHPRARVGWEDDAHPRSGTRCATCSNSIG